MKKTKISVFCVTLALLNLMIFNYRAGYSAPYCDQLYIVEPFCINDDNASVCSEMCNHEPICPNSTGTEFSGAGNYTFGNVWDWENENPQWGLFTGQMIITMCWREHVCVTGEYQGKGCRYSGNGIWYCSTEAFKTCRKCTDGPLTGAQHDIYIPDQLECVPRYVLNETQSLNEIAMR